MGVGTGVKVFTGVDDGGGVSVAVSRVTVGVDVRGIAVAGGLVAVAGRGAGVCVGSATCVVPVAVAGAVTMMGGGVPLVSRPLAHR